MIGVVIIPVVLFLIGLIGERIFKNVQNNLCNDNQVSLEPTNTFSVSAYYERLEELYQELLEQEERKSDSEEYVIILWWGLDGLRLNKDGSSEWISKKKDKDIQQIPVYPQLYPTYIQSYNPLINPLNCQLQQCCSTSDYWNVIHSQCAQNRISELQERERLLAQQMADNAPVFRVSETLQGGRGNSCTKEIDFTWG